MKNLRYNLTGNNFLRFFFQSFWSILMDRFQLSQGLESHCSIRSGNHLIDPGRIKDGVDLGNTLVILNPRYLDRKSSTLNGGPFVYLSVYSTINPLRANPTKWSNTLKQFVGCWRRIVWVCLNLWGCRLKG